MRTCKVCGEQVSFFRSDCNYCGYRDQTVFTLKNIFIVAAIFLPVMIIGGYSSEPEPDSGYVIQKSEPFTHYSKSTATVRGMAGDIHNKNYELTPGDRVVVNDSTDGWYRLRSEEYSNGKRKTGWVKKSALTKYNEEAYRNANYSSRSTFTDYTKESPKNRVDTFINKSTAYYECERLVKRRLKKPSTAVFPRASGNKFQNTFKDGNGLQVHSYVDSENSYGATVRTGFSCWTERVSGDNWVVKRLEMD